MIHRELTKKNINFLSKDLNLIRHNLKSQEFQYVSKTAGNAHSFGYAYRAKQAGAPWQNLPIRQALEGPAMKRFLQQETGQEAIHIDRCQVHYYPVGGSILKHVDTDTEPQYSHTVLLGLESNYEGGMFRVFAEGGIHEFKLNQAELLVCPSHLPHDLTPVTSGERLVLVFFLKRPKKAGVPEDPEKAVPFVPELTQRSVPERPVCLQAREQ